MRTLERLERALGWRRRTRGRRAHRRTAATLVAVVEPLRARGGRAMTGASNDGELTLALCRALHDLGLVDVRIGRRQHGAGGGARRNSRAGRLRCLAMGDVPVAAARLDGAQAGVDTFTPTVAATGFDYLPPEGEGGGADERRDPAPAQRGRGPRLLTLLLDSSLADAAAFIRSHARSLRRRTAPSARHAPSRARSASRRRAGPDPRGHAEPRLGRSVAAVAAVRVSSSGVPLVLARASPRHGGRVPPPAVGGDRPPGAARFARGAAGDARARRRVAYHGRGARPRSLTATTVRRSLDALHW